MTSRSPMQPAQGQARRNFSMQDKTFMPAIIPFDGQFRANLLKIGRLHIKILLGQLTAGNRLCPPSFLIILEDAVFEGLTGGVEGHLFLCALATGLVIRGIGRIHSDRTGPAWGK